VTAFVAIVAVVVLSLTHNTEGASAVGGIAVTTIGGMQLGMRNRQ
jgi:hypothetical protein